MAKVKRPTDVNQRAKMIVDLATGEIPEDKHGGKNPAAVELGRLGGLKGGKARAEKLSPERRREIALKAIQTRWEKEKVKKEKGTTDNLDIMPETDKVVKGKKRKENKYNSEEINDKANKT